MSRILIPAPDFTPPIPPRAIGMTTVAYALTHQTVGLRSTRSMAIAVTVYVLTHIAVTLRKNITIHMSVATYVLTYVAMVLARKIAPTSKFKLRRSEFVLRKTRQSDPTLSD